MFFFYLSRAPEVAPVRFKMLYAGTKHTLTKTLGSEKFEGVTSAEELVILKRNSKAGIKHQ